MRTLKLLAFIGFYLFAGKCFAQKVTPKAIENDLLKTFKKIDYWYFEKRQNDTTMTWSDSLDAANDKYAAKLRFYADGYPSIFDIRANYKPDKSLGLCSDDGRLWIYSWDTNLGGTQHIFESVIQYRQGPRIITIVDTAKSDAEYTYDYDKIFMLKIGQKNYYLATYYGILGLNARLEGIRVFAIENGKLNEKVRLIKTKKGLTNKLSYRYDQSLTNSDIMSETSLEYDPNEKTIRFPVVTGDGKVTGEVIRYKFTGKYFEKVK